MNRFQKVVLALLSALVLVVAIAAVLIVQRQNAEAEQAAFLQCMEIRGFTPENSMGKGVDAAFEAAAECGR